jgi:hypothetical protein
MKHLARFASLIVFAAFMTLVAPAAMAGCTTGVELGQASAGCLKSGAQTRAYVAGHSDHTYSIRPACEIGGATLCAEAARCNIEGHPGFLFNVYEDDAPDPLDWQACLTRQEARRLGGLTPGMVERAFRRLDWPSSDLVVQPPDGRTLVNFATNFYTTNTGPTTRTVTLVGQRVTVEATPTSYTWHFGDDGDLTTTDPGAAYPDLQVTHRYTRVGAVAPSVDTTYSGRYRVGNGGWQTIPDTLTVPGTPVDLRVVSATPHLVGY